jgi:hypothetical protein
MKRGTIAVLLALTAVACWGQDTAVHPFIPRPARTSDALARQVESNPVYMDRFVRHFQMKPSEVSAYLRSLRLAKLDKDTEVIMYNAPQSGAFRSRKLLLKKGTEVWVDSSGTPVLKANCGNPLTRTDQATRPSVSGQVSQPMGFKEVELPKGGAAEVVMQVHPIEPMAPVIPEVQFETPPPVTEVTSSGRELAPFAGGLLFLPSALVGFNSGGVIPEPATLTAVGFGVGYLLLRRRKR